ncbi:hypothetical protein [Streptomyces sp. NPDC049555]|uniref:DUF7144 family membrane protein n=1 Tax=Streptomyces sp. NPDC049555 TaxID=3154930 RepID=UPI0034415572
MSPTSTRHHTTSRAVAGGLTYFAAVMLLIANVLSLPYHPLWSLVVMALCAFVIWGLCTSGPAGAGK